MKSVDGLTGSSPTSPSPEGGRQVSDHLFVRRLSGSESEPRRFSIQSRVRADRELTLSCSQGLQSSVVVVGGVEGVPGEAGRGEENRRGGVEELGR